ncbi:ABC transporter substrate-binding protein [Haloferax mediterranei ATCC 33500]|uniref:ABC transporter substrate-binding protein n=1 Tax=Haloferax mediterranei (strain ATCC 33500 / DSM 1411 / JCM 8866 / NBRC 14739 / NCIMB 2177 / R-4) TaxID=523841 RepID=I3R588_HALMT|nr:ABC transporter substrate-binding protein [Haloferax mediterranei]AFK19398.1 hypothetical protein HFX_1692 [Haloferax mediterranei ATCC 33500]AHZ21252.1 Fe3+-hydroxamate ABC transporter substrate-binding protein [Haloferax mediterranei ATCC 33500]EMA04413.1 hypothetical protein C439_02022 [Haloferax mediterranei ATCC 33500]MDX5989501.1 ABC transporter substrate-binding protein [Haloferax mediterranei ATCC 33500]QCQ75860.1 ABC transporter substrate-binding protein [Haloferax mediterranei ATC
MDRDSGRRTEPTRREYLKYGGAVVGGGLFAGCLGDDGADSTPTESNSPSTSTETETTDTETTTEDSSYSVTMEPVGEVPFDQVPEKWFSFTGDYADMGVALGQADGLQAVGIRQRFATWYYNELPGVSVDREGLTQLWQDGTDKELFYELDADVHIIDPNFMINRIQWTQEDIDEISENVGPFLGNTIFSGSYSWHDYTKYSMYEAFEKLAQVFQEEERYEALKEIHDRVVSDVTSRLPEERPEVAILYPRSSPPETFLPFVMDSGTSFKQWRELNVRDALAQSDVQNFHESRSEVDFETLLEVDPEVIAIRQHGELTEAEFESKFVQPMKDHDLGSELQAVQNDRVIYAGAPYQGPIVYLFQLEQAAQDLYPDVFTEDEFFDRQRVADIVTGEF